MVRLFNGLVCLLAVTMLVACAKTAERSEISLVLPDWDAMRNADIARRSKVSTLAVDQARIHAVIATVTASGMPPAEFKWDRGNNAAAVAPTKIGLAATKGPQRKVQLLALYAGDAGMEFYYASATKDFALDNESLELTLKNVATELKLVEGRIIGRFLTHKNADGVAVGPTMKFQYRFFPPNAADPRESMVITTGEMFSGWVDLTSFNSSIIGYTNMAGDALAGFDRNFSFESQGLYGVDGDSVRSMRFHVPAAWENESHQNGQYEMRPSGMKKVVLGFFGPESGTKRVCYTAPSPAEALDDFFTDQAHSTPVKWYETGSPSETSKAFVERGGMKTGTCGAAGGEFINYLVLNHKKAGRHAEDMVGFKGPFQKVSSDNGYNQFANVTYDGSSALTIAWKYLPGVKATLRGATVFWREVASTDIWNHTDDIKEIMGDGFLCGQIAKEPATYGFSAQSVSQNDETATITGIPDSTHAQKTQILVCPKGQDFQGNEIHFNYGQIAAYFSNGGGGGGGGGNSTEVRITGAMNVPFNSCQTLTATHFVNQVQTNVSGTNLVINVNANDDIYALADTGCASPLAPKEVEIPIGASSVQFRYKPTTSGVHQIGGMIGSGWVQSFSMASVKPQTASGLTIRIDGDYDSAPMPLVSGQCYPVEFELRSSTEMGNNSSKNYSLAFGTGAGFFTSQDCTTGSTTTLSFTSSEAYQRLYFKAGTADSAINAGTATPTANRAYTVDPAGVNHWVLVTRNGGFSGGIFYQPNTCVEAHLEARTIRGARYNPTTAITTTVSTGTNIISAANNCSSPTNSRSVQVSSFGSDTFYVNVGTAMSRAFNVTSPSQAVSIYRQPDALDIMNPPSNNIIANCHRLRFSPDFSGSNVPAAANLKYRVMITGPMTAYTEQSCTTTYSSVNNTGTLAAGNPYFDLWVMTSTSGATINVGFDGTTTPQASLTSSSDACTGFPSAGTVCDNGALFLGGTGGWNYMTTPGNCTDSSTPTCNGAKDTLTKTYGVAGTVYNATSNSDGPINVLNLLGIGSTPAALWCDNLNYGGYTDWYLPAIDELAQIHAWRAGIGGVDDTSFDEYWSSTEFDDGMAKVLNVNGGGDTSGTALKNTSQLVRCVRRI